MQKDKLFRRAALPSAALLGILACATLRPPAPPIDSVFDSGRTAFGFFPSAPEVSILSVWNNFRAMSAHADSVLIQQPVAWDDFRAGIDGQSARIEDIRGQVELAWRNGMEPIFVVDPLNGLNRREFSGLPPELAGAGFGHPDVRSAFQNQAVRMARDFHPRYLGLASEINTYADAFPEDFPNYLSLYRDTYRKIKMESPGTQVFVTFQWEDLYNLGVFAEGGGPGIQWDLIEAFEPELDLWVISSYPFAAFETAAEIPEDYYTPLLDRTEKPLAVAEGGFGSSDIPPFHGTPGDQVLYLNAVHDQLGGRLAFWIYLILDDFNMESYQAFLEAHGMGKDVETLRLFSTLGLRQRDGTPKPALAVWDGYREDAIRQTTPPAEAGL
ncbi:MAG: hypothetical protein JW748_14160 [Anaerolineales bacterium]|nr:hypothetical protein [Anaerolineales bacterium]